MSDTLRDSILKSESGQRMIDRVTPIYDNSYVGLWMFEAIGREWDTFWELVLSLQTELNPDTATWMLGLWERRYGITPPAGATIAQRRQAIAQMRILPQPLSPYRLEQYLETITGRKASVTENIAPYTFGITITGGDGDAALSYEGLKKYINRHKPSHMAYELCMQAATGISLHVETGYWKFEYLFCGTLPQYNLTSGRSNREIRTQPETGAYTYPYLPCGVYALGGGIL